MLKQIDDLFPKAESRPIAARKALKGCASVLDAPKWRQFNLDLWNQQKPGQNGVDGKYFNHVRMDFNKPSPTIPKSAVFGGFVGLSHCTVPRSLNLGELMRLGSYPDKFVFIGSYEARLNRIGNSVPPLFMRSIARQIRSVMFDREQPKVNGKLKQVDDYPALLDACWQEHLAPRAANAPTVISTFAGAGGSSLGYSMAGYRELLAVEWDDNAVETFQLNFPGVPVYHGDIAKLSVDECMELAGLTGPGELDVLDGSPPCQGFSTAGKRDFGDDRNQLFREYVRLLRGLRPKVFVMENVSGMVKGIMKLIFADIMRELKASDYIVSARLLNAMYFNVPQSRERMIFIGVRDDLGIAPSHPKAESRAVTVRDAFCNLAEFDKSNLFWKGEKGLEIIKNIRPGEDGSSGFKRLTGKENRWFNLRRLDYDLPSWIIIKGSGASSLIHPEEDRILSVVEYKRIASFPDKFSFIGSGQDCKARIGNSVPPLFMRSIARHVSTEILGNGRSQ